MLQRGIIFWPNSEQHLKSFKNETTLNELDQTMG